MSEAPQAPSPKSPAPPVRPRREGWGARLVRGLLAGALALAAVVVVLIGWLGGTQSGLQSVIDLAVRLSGGSVSVENAEGYVFGQLKLGALHVRTPTLHLDIRDLTIEWRPAALGSSGLEIASLSAAEVAVASASSDEPTTLPASLELPKAARIDRFRIDRLSIGKLIDGQPAPPDMEVTALSGSLVSDGRRHRLTDLKAAAPFGRLAANLELDGRRPFPLGATASLATRQADEAYTVEARASGNLESLQLDATASGAGMPRSAANLVITMLPNAITMPQDRSMPAVRMTSVWPMAITPTTITCCRISAKFAPEKKLSVVSPNTAQATARAMKGPSCDSGGRRSLTALIVDTSGGEPGGGCSRARGSGKACRFVGRCFGTASAMRRRDPPPRHGGRVGDVQPSRGEFRGGATPWATRAAIAAAEKLLSAAPCGAVQQDYFLPQHRSVPVLTSLLSTPLTALAAIRVTPVST